MLYDADLDPAPLAGKTVAVIGFGNQGRAQALNLKDSGIDVRVGLRVRAVWAEPGTGDDATGGGMTGSWGDFLGWSATGEPDATDPDLVNRIF